MPIFIFPSCSIADTTQVTVLLLLFSPPPSPPGPPSAAPRLNNHHGGAGGASSSAAAAAAGGSNFKRTNTVDTATIKENSPRYGVRPSTAVGPGASAAAAGVTPTKAGIEREQII